MQEILPLTGSPRLLFKVNFNRGCLLTLPGLQQPTQGCLPDSQFLLARVPFLVIPIVSQRTARHALEGPTGGAVVLLEKK